jgi:hypothetical protein
MSAEPITYTVDKPEVVELVISYTFKDGARGTVNITEATVEQALASLDYVRERMITRGHRLDLGARS